MASLMQRRREMMQTASSGGEAPLYQFKQGTSSDTGRSIVISDNHIIHNRTATNNASRGLYVGETASGSAVLTAAWFSVNPGDVVRVKIKNIEYANHNTAYECNYYVQFKNASGTTVFSSATATYPRGGTGTLADIEETTTIENAADITCALFWSTRNALSEYDLELYVNGIRYI